MNKVCLIGRICQDVVLKSTPSGVYTTSNTLAVTRQFKNANGEYESDFINIVAWRNTAEFICKYIKKGNLIGIEGRIQTRSYENTQGQKVYVTEILVEQVELLEKKNNEKQEKPQSDTQPQNDPFADFGESVTLDDNFLD